MAFRVGQKVVCVDDDISLDGLDQSIEWTKAHGLARGLVYTVSKVGCVHQYDLKKRPCIHVAEIDRPIDQPIWANRFRPLVSTNTDISIFTAMLGPRERVGSDT